MSCNSLQPESQKGSITGTVLHPDNNFVIQIKYDGRVDTVSFSLGSHQFTISNLKYGTYVLQVIADGYEIFEKEVVLNSPLVTYNEITLSHKGSISGKILHPDNNLIVRIISVGRTDTVSLDPGSHLFTLRSLKYGNYIIQVTAAGYTGFEQKIVLNTPVYTCHDIILSRAPGQISYLFPSSSQNLDMQYFNFHEPQVNDSGFNPEIAFNQEMDTASANKVITILPDTVGVEVIWSLNRVLVVHFPYWKLATVDTVRVSVRKEAINIYGDSLDSDYSVFYPIDKEYIRTNYLKK
jgi:hypothetical protein